MARLLAAERGIKWRGCKKVGSLTIVIFVRNRPAKILDTALGYYLPFDGALNPILNEPAHDAALAFSIRADLRQILKISVHDRF